MSRPSVAQVESVDDARELVAGASKLQDAIARVVANATEIRARRGSERFLRRSLNLALQQSESPIA